MEYARQHWREFSRSRPGKRFQERYRRRQESNRGRFRNVRRVVNLTLGVLIVVISAVGGLLPGPGWGTAIIGFALIAGEVLAAARLLDWSEIRVRRVWQFIRDIWGHSWAGKVLVALVTLILITAFAYLIYFVLFAG